MKLKGWALAALAALAVPAFAATDSGDSPTTKMETFAARVGVAVLREYVEVGAISSMGKVAVDARILRNMARPTESTTGIRIEVTEATRLNRSVASYIDKDEIAPLLEGIDHVRRQITLSEGMTNFETEYRTTGDLSITVFNDHKNDIKAAIYAGRITPARAFVSVEQLGQLRDLIVQANAIISGE